LNVEISAFEKWLGERKYFLNIEKRTYKYQHAVDKKELISPKPYLINEKSFYKNFF